MEPIQRRSLLLHLAGGLTGVGLAGHLTGLGPGAPTAAAGSGASGAASLVEFFIPAESTPPTDEAFQARLVEATLKYLRADFRGQRLVYWQRRPECVDFGKRLRWIVHWIAEGIRRAAEVYPVDAVWLLAQIMQESFFYEFTLSPALAAGICQFIPGTAREYGLRVAGPETDGPIRRRELAGKGNEYESLRAERRAFRAAHGDRLRLELEDLLELVAAGRAAERSEDARFQLETLRELERFDRRIGEASQQYRTFLSANVEGRDIFDPRDAAFLRSFDQRFLYAESVPAMVLYMARMLRARKGNLVAAAAGYNAGLRRTLDEGFYREYGRIPDIGETETYISRILVNHHRISTYL